MTDGPDPDLEFQARHAFERPCIGLMAAIGWVAHRNMDRAFDIGFWRFCDASERDRSLFAAKEELWRALQKGEIAANGVDARGKTVDIPALEWRFLEFAPAVDSVVSYRDSSLNYRAVAVETKTLRKLRPGKPAPAAVGDVGRPADGRDLVLKYLSENFRPTDVLPKPASIAKDLGVSRQTVMRAINIFRVQK